MRSKSLSLTAAVAATFAPCVAVAGVVANGVVDYTPGDFTNFQSEKGDTTAASALGFIATDTPFGAVNPFNPAYLPSQIVAVGPGGQLTLKMATPLLATTRGATLGVFSNNGLDDFSSDGSGLAGNPAVTFNDPAHPEAVVSVSSDGVTYVPLNAGNPVVFANPTNYYTDTPIRGYSQAAGVAHGSQYIPFTGTLASFNGETYAQILTTLNGSDGGTWLDLSGTGLATVNDVRFVVPAGANYSFVVDSVSAVPEPVALLPLAGLLPLVGRRKRVR